MKKITTYSGSVYLFDEEAMTMSRKPAEDGSKLRLDEQMVPVVEVITMEVGVIGEWLLDRQRKDGCHTYRRTTAIQSIEEV
jgi:hypothetical protein